MDSIVEQLNQEKIGKSDEILIAAERISEKMCEFTPEENKPPYDLKLNESRRAVAATADGIVKISSDKKIDRIFIEGVANDIVRQDDLVIWNDRGGNGSRDVVLTQRLGEMPRLSVHDKDGVVFFELAQIDPNGKVEWRQTKVLGAPFKDKDQNPLTYAVNLFNGIFVSSLVLDAGVSDKKLPISEPAV